MEPPPLGSAANWDGHRWVLISDLSSSNSNLKRTRIEAELESRIKMNLAESPPSANRPIKQLKSVLESCIASGQGMTAATVKNMLPLFDSVTKESQELKSINKNTIKEKTKILSNAAASFKGNTLRVKNDLEKLKNISEAKKEHTLTVINNLKDHLKQLQSENAVLRKRQAFETAMFLANLKHVPWVTKLK